MGGILGSVGTGLHTPDRNMRQTDHLDRIKDIEPTPVAPDCPAPTTDTRRPCHRRRGRRATSSAISARFPSLIAPGALATRSCGADLGSTEVPTRPAAIRARRRSSRARGPKVASSSSRPGLSPTSPCRQRGRPYMRAESASGTRGSTRGPRGPKKRSRVEKRPTGPWRPWYGRRSRSRPTGDGMASRLAAQQATKAGVRWRALNIMTHQGMPRSERVAASSHGLRCESGPFRQRSVHPTTRLRLSDAAASR